MLCDKVNRKFFNCLDVLTTCSDTKMLRSGNFCADRRQTKPIILSLAHVYGVKIYGGGGGGLIHDGGILVGHYGIL